MTNLKNLNDYNNDREKEHYRVANGVSCTNGIECPKCLAELWDDQPDTLILDNGFPPRKKIHCKACNFTGYRYP